MFIAYNFLFSRDTKKAKNVVVFLSSRRIVIYNYLVTSKFWPQVMAFDPDTLCPNIAAEITLIQNLKVFSHSLGYME